MAGTQNQPIQYEQVTYNTSSGAQFHNASTYGIGFYGKTPVSRYVGCGAASTYLTTSNTTSTCGFSDMASLTSMILQVSTITQALRGVGLID